MSIRNVSIISGVKTGRKKGKQINEYEILLLHFCMSLLVYSIDEKVYRNFCSLYLSTTLWLHGMFCMPLSMLS